MDSLLPTGREVIPESVETYLQSYGFQGVPGGDGWPRLEVQIHGHSEVSGHTLYNIQCIVSLPGMASADWHTSKRLMQIRENLRDMLKTRLGREKMDELFVRTPFACRGGVPGTTARLTVWCQKLAELISTGKVPLAVVAEVMQFLDAPGPGEMYYDSTSSCLARSSSFMSADSNDDALELTMSDTPEYGEEVPRTTADKEAINIPEEESDNEPLSMLSSKTCIPFGDGTGHVKDGDATAILVRGPTYHQTQSKDDSLPAFYELVRVEVLKPPSHGEIHTNVASMGVMNALQALGTAPEGPLPQYFILNLQLPEGAPPMWGSDVRCCSSLVLCFRVKTETQAAAMSTTCDPALELLKGYCCNAPRDFSIQSKMKLIGHAENLSVPSVLGSMFERYNGRKPVIITKSGYLISGPGYLEMDVDIRQFNILARRALYQVWGCTSTAKLNLAAVIQGDHATELPERVFGCATLNALDLPQLTSAVTA